MVVYARCGHLLEKGYTFHSEFEVSLTAFSAWPYMSQLPAATFLDEHVFFRVICSSASFAIVHLLHNSVFD